MGASLTTARILTKSKKSYQEVLDIWDLYCMTYYYRNCGGQNIKMKPPQAPEFEKQFQEVHSCVTEQLVGILRGIDSQVCAKQSKSQLQHLDSTFSLSVEKSLIDHPDAGQGVFLRGSAVPGTVVMFHPGLVYLPLHVSKMPNYPWVEKDNTYLMSRYDGCIIDPKSLDTDIQTSDGISIPHPYAAGHKVNHPPPAGKPNIMPYSYDFQPQFPADLLKLVPNKYYREPGFLFKTSAVLRSVVYVTTNHVCNEELFVNYRLNPKCKRPDWYTPVDSKGDSRRWNG